MAQPRAATSLSFLPPWKPAPVRVVVRARDAGEGTVVRAVPEVPTHAGGMELEFVATDDASRALVCAMGAPGGVRRRASNGAGVSRRRSDAAE
jgi:hypothetical protein